MCLKFNDNLSLNCHFCLYLSDQCEDYASPLAEIVSKDIKNGSESKMTDGQPNVHLMENVENTLNCNMPTENK